ncbi:hypothetical protein [Amycolatopsis sp. RTGN1]|uniref:hypothetical protein n=1 Tax=Amycolatopsis ponsaeliensis TaxID=2992142 RepID=UPI00255126E2|nr:hypothetical protein [Amycolatopsis sp. RTGN1]
MSQPANSPVWEPPPPRQLPTLRSHLAEHLHSEPAHLLTTAALRAGRGTIRPDTGPELGAALLLEDEHQRLCHAQLFYVTPDITTLIRQAAPSLKEEWGIQPHDVPARTGFMVFAEPMAEYVRDDGVRIDIVAVSWGETDLLSSSTGGLWVTFWSVTDFAALRRLARAAGANPREADVMARSQRAELTWDNEVYMPWGAGRPDVPDPGDGVRAVDPRRIAAAKTTLEWLQTVHAAWIFCTPNALAETTEEHLPRTQRIRAERVGHNATPVRVVSVSRKRVRSSPRSGEPSGRTVSVRFPVAPFIRNQAYGPGRQFRRLTPIAGHWRGPADAPVRISKTVNLVDTPVDRRPAP